MIVANLLLQFHASFIALKLLNYLSDSYWVGGEDEGEGSVVTVTPGRACLRVGRHTSHSEYFRI